MVRPSHNVLIDSLQIEKKLYTDLNNFIKLEVFFVRKKYFSHDAKEYLNTILTNTLMQVPKKIDVVGHHVYQIFENKILEDKIFIPKLVNKAFFIIKHNEQIIAKREIAINAVYTRSIYIKFVGYDFSIKLQ